MCASIGAFAQVFGMEVVVAAIGQWAADASPDVLAGLGAARTGAAWTLRTRRAARTGAAAPNVKNVNSPNP